MSTQRVPSYGSSSSRSWKYDVFMNFEGEGTGKNFTDHLYVALDQEGFEVYKSDKEIERGSPVSPEIVRKAIEESRISVVVFSKRYASSTPCLDELVNISECKKTVGQMIIPIFYDVEPSVPRYQIGDFQEAFAEHEETFKENKLEVEAWRNTLKEVANLSGFPLKDRYESELIEDVVEEVRGKLSVSGSRLMNLKKVLVGVSSCLEQLWMQAEIRRPRVQWRQSSIAPTLIPLFFFEPFIEF
ncbi:toll/interleukin-1 receptor-like protein [Pistacia vera]|uniref:toll/interleukin-1 receptor-like protein n=1 Tax=Pistacia vera TaxID=55513 RepID=UPI001263DB4A|nr:toll/interleukin-1 receptor-like protein [Pistacia vera]XP_031280694.1 toll/interleukin-1 receptor-like protein [Pistacia vera]